MARHRRLCTASRREVRQVRGIVTNPGWAHAFDLGAKLAILSERWGSPCSIAKDLITGRYAVWLGECPLASGDTPPAAVEAALELWPCNQCTETEIPPKVNP